MSDKIQDTKTPDMGTSSLAGAQLAIAEMLAPQEDNAEVSSTTTDIESEDLESTGEAYEDAEIEEADEDFDSEDDDADLADDEEELEQEEGDANTFTVKVAGEEVTVDLDELKSGYSRQSDYTKKAQALADERKNFEQDRDAVLLERQQYSQLLGALQQQLVSLDEPAPDFDRLYDEDPIEATRQERMYQKRTQERQAKMQAIAQEQQRVNDANALEQQQQMRGLIQAEAARLPEVIPEWKDEKVAGKQREQLREYLLEQGVAEDEMAALVRANHIKVLRKAMLYDQGQRRVRKARKQGQSTGTVKAGNRPQSKPTQRRVKAARQRFAGTGRRDDAASLLESLL